MGKTYEMGPGKGGKTPTPKGADKPKKKKKK